MSKSFRRYSVSPYQETRDMDSFLSSFALYLEGNTTRLLRLAVVHSSDFDPELLTRKHGIRHRIICESPIIYSFEKTVNIMGLKDGVHTVKWLAINHENSGLFIIASFEKGDMFKKYISKCINGVYPYLSRFYLSTGHIEKMVNKIKQNEPQATIRINKIIYKKRINESLRGKQIASAIEWSDIPHEQAFSKIYEENAWLNSISLRVSLRKEGEHLEAEGTINRDGSVNCKANFMFFYHAIITEILTLAADESKVLEKRSRKREDFRVRPLAIVFDNNIFSDKSENRRLIEALHQMPKASLSVYHGNPYIKANLIDNKDGSYYQIWVLSEDSIIISPQMKASPASLKRICNHIGEKFLEGEIKDLSEVELHAG